MVARPAAQRLQAAGERAATRVDSTSRLFHTFWSQGSEVTNSVAAFGQKAAKNGLLQGRKPRTVLDP